MLSLLEFARLLFFFFKQKTAYAMRISDWSSDVCSSDLLMNLQRAEKLVPGKEFIEVQFANGAALKAKSVIISTGARWRQMNVPGENEYRNKGVAYCPHCDGPLFKGKRVAVIGDRKSTRLNSSH